ncbi:MAG: glycerol-3-phosphate dehydrogenase subunit GlpB [Candidatus Abyssubacteria bacterium]
MEADVIVIGGGMAGTVAALRAAESGAQVVLVRKGHGATAMSSGTFDIAGPEDFLPFDPWDSIPSIEEQLRRTLRARPLHPYSILAGGRDGLKYLLSRLHEATDFVRRKLSGMNLTDGNGRNMALPSVFGTVKLCAMAPASMSGGNLLEMRDANLALVGIGGLMLFQPHVCKQVLEKCCSLHSPRSLSQVEIIETHVPRALEALPSAPFEIAHHFDAPDVAEEFAKRLAPRISSSASHICFPPVLGLRNHSQTYDIFSSILKSTVFEMISPNFSVPGFRLQQALDAALRERGVRVVTSDVVGAERDGRNVRNLLLEDLRTKRTVAARNYVVASGKFSAGGLVANDYPREPVFGLPLFSHGRRVDTKFVQDMLDWNVDEKQLFVSCGVHIDGSLKPLDRFGEPAYENLFAAGSIIGEYDYITDKCGMGIAMLTGYLAGEQAAG